MAEPSDEQDVMSETGTQRRNETSETEHDRVRGSNDLDQEVEREGGESRHNRGYDEAVRGAGERNSDVDPDSAESAIERDDTIKE